MNESGVKISVQSHEVVRHLTEVVIYPYHAKRAESEEFRKNKQRLKDDGHFRCWVCGKTDGLAVHHFGCEWALADICDFDKLKKFCETFDPYGYGNLLMHRPMSSVDDIRNLLVLCEEHHVGGSKDGSANGIHEITFPVWLIQKLAKTGEDPVPERKESPNASF